MPIDFQVLPDGAQEATPKIDFRAEGTTPIDFQPEEDTSYAAQLKDLGITPEEAAAAVAPAERMADLAMARKRLLRRVDLQQPITDLESVVSGVAHPIQAAGMVINSAGNLTKALALDLTTTPSTTEEPLGLTKTKEVLRSAGQRGPSLPPAVEGNPVKEGLVEAAGMVPMVAASVGLEALGIPAPLAMGGPMGASAYAATGSPQEGLKAAATGMVLPALGQVGKLAVAKTIAAAAERGLVSGNATLAQKALESVGSQVLVQGALEGMNLEEYWNMPPEERKARIVRNLVANAAFGAMEAPHVLGPGASVTEGELGPGAKAGQLMEALIKDPVAQEALRQRVDDFVFDAMRRGPSERGSVERGSVERPGVAVDFVPEMTADAKAAEAQGREQIGTGEGSEEVAAMPAPAGDERIRSLVERAQGSKVTTGARVDYGRVEADEAAALKEATGLELEGYQHMVDDSAVRHILKEHGDAAREEARGQEAVTAEDIARIPEVVSNPDRVESGGESGIGRDLIRYEKRFNGTTYYVEEVRTGRGKLAAQTMYKRPAAAPRATPEGGDAHTSETIRGQAGENLAEGGGESKPLASVERATLPRQIEAPSGVAPDLTQPVSLAEIRKYLSTALDIPVRMGVSIRGGIRGALGFFRVKPETIRLKALNDIPTLAHEVGHYLHFLLFPRGGVVGAAGDLKSSKFAGRFDGELMALGARTSLKSYTQHQVRQEGVAEFVREWMTDRSQALAKAPGFTQFFEGELQAKFPEVWRIVTRAREELGRYIAQPALMKVRSMVSRRAQPEGTTVREWFGKQYSNWVNDLAPMERSLRTLEKFGLPAAQAKRVSDYAVNYIGGWRGKVEHSLFARQIDLNGRDIGPGLREILQGVESLDEFGDYLVAKRALEKNLQGKVTGIETADAREVVTALEAKYRARADKLRRWQEGNLLLLVDAGVISREQFNKMNLLNQDYVPFFRVYEGLGGGAGTKKGEGFVNLGQGVGRFKGSDRQIIDPLESVVKNAYLFRDLAERNRVGQLFVDAVEGTRGGGRVAESIARKVKPTQVSHDEVIGALQKAGLDTAALGLDDMDLAFKVWRAARNQSAKDGTFTVWKEGKEQPYQLDDPELMRALALADATDAKFFASIPGLKVARGFTRLLRVGATLTPDFIVRNPFRDQVTAGVFSKYGFVPFYDGFRGVFSALGKDKWYYDWMAAGGRYSDFVAMDRPDLVKTLEDVVKSPGALRTALGLANPLNVLKNLQKFSELMEQATRISEFRRAKQAGASDVEAANASKDVTLNFARGGFKGKFVNQMVAFFNASVQDLDKTIRAHRERPLQTTLKGMMYITVPSLLAWYLGKDDKEIQNLPEWRKNFFWNVNLRDIAKVAGAPADGDFVLSFPKPFLLGQLYGTSVERGLDYVSGRDPNGVRKWLGGLLQTTPLSIDALVPTLVRPLVEGWANKSFFRGQPLESAGMQELPPAQRLTPQSSLVGRLVSEQLPWEWGVSPIKFDNTVRGYLGGLGKYGSDATDWLIAKTKMMDVPPAPEKSMWELPMLRGFVRTPYEASAYVERFYKGMELAEQRVNAVHKMPLLMENGQQKRFLDSEARDLAFYLSGGRIEQLRAGRKQLGEVVKAMTMVQVSRGLAPAEKAEKLKQLSGARDALAEMLFKSRLSAGDQRRVY